MDSDFQNDQSPFAFISSNMHHGHVSSTTSKLHTPALTNMFELSQSGLTIPHQ
jgi:hypothetical protein